MSDTSHRYEYRTEINIIPYYQFFIDIIPGAGYRYKYRIKWKIGGIGDIMMDLQVAYREIVELVMENARVAPDSIRTVRVHFNSSRDNRESRTIPVL